MDSSNTLLGNERRCDNFPEAEGGRAAANASYRSIVLWANNACVEAGYRSIILPRVVRDAIAAGGVAAVEQLHDAYAFFQQPASKDAIVGVLASQFAAAFIRVEARANRWLAANGPGIEAEVSVGGNIENKMIAGPTIRLLGETVEFQPGDPKRLIGGKGTYTYHAAITMHRADILDAAMVLSADDVVFSVHP